MDLARALKAAAPFAAAPKGLAVDDPRQGIQVRPHFFHAAHPVPMVNDVPLPLYPGFVHAQDGDVGVMIVLDPEVDARELVVNAKEAAKAVKGKKDFRLEQTASNLATFAMAGGAQLNAVAYDHGKFPPPPPLPASWRPASMGAVHAVLRTLHAAAKDRADRPELARLHLTRGWTEASDQRRISRSHVGLVADDCLVSPDLFQGWPKKWPDTGVSVGVAGGTPGAPEWLWVQCGEELRFAKVHPASGYFRLDNLLPEKDHGYFADFTVERLLEAAARAAETSGDGLVELAFSHNSLEVRGVTAKGAVTCSSVLHAPGASPVAPVRLVLNARFLKEALKVRGHQVRMFWSGPHQPLRLEDPATTELLWPLVLDDAPIAEAKA